MNPILRALKYIELEQAGGLVKQPTGSGWTLFIGRKFTYEFTEDALTDQAWSDAVDAYLVHKGRQLEKKEPT